MNIFLYLSTRLFPFPITLRPYLSPISFHHPLFSPLSLPHLFPPYTLSFHPFTFPHPCTTDNISVVGGNYKRENYTSSTHSAMPPVSCCVPTCAGASAGIGGEVAWVVYVRRRGGVRHRWRWVMGRRYWWRDWCTVWRESGYRFPGIYFELKKKKKKKVILGQTLRQRRLQWLPSTSLYRHTYIHTRGYYNNFNVNTRIEYLLVLFWIDRYTNRMAKEQYLMRKRPCGRDFATAVDLKR